MGAPFSPQAFRWSYVVIPTVLGHPGAKRRISTSRDEDVSGNGMEVGQTCAERLHELGVRTAG